MYVDPSGKGKDETAYSILGQRDGYLFLLDNAGFIDGFGDPTLEAIALAAKVYSANRIIVESNFGGGMFAKLLGSKLREVDHQAAVEDDHATGQKEARICDVLEPVLRSHKLIVRPSVIENDYQRIPRDMATSAEYRLFYQLSRMTRVKKSLSVDDRLDSLAGAVKAWTEVMSQSAKTQAQTRLEDDLEKFRLRKRTTPRTLIDYGFAGSPESALGPSTSGNSLLGES
jgi:hypothetical protein